MFKTNNEQIPSKLKPNSCSYQGKQYVLIIKKIKRKCGHEYDSKNCIKPHNHNCSINV